MANQDSDLITAFNVDPERWPAGLKQNTVQVRVASPVWLEVLGTGTGTGTGNGTGTDTDTGRTLGSGNHRHGEL